MRRLRWLVFHTWNIPPVVGLGFILLIGVLTPTQLLGILITPLEPAYILGWLAFSVWFLPRRMQPVADWLDARPGASLERALERVRSFPLVYWATFLVYLVLAPVSVIVAAEIYTGFVATPITYFRIELVALIVSIVVGLPIFFLVFDLFGRALGPALTGRPIFTIRTKVILIGALVPLLIDTMLVQYYWTRTGFFSAETFVVWLLLELLAIAGALVFAHSFGQSLAPLQGFIGAGPQARAADAQQLRARSTDELGRLTSEYRALLANLQLHGEILEISNRLWRQIGNAPAFEAAFPAVVDLARQAVQCDQAFLVVHDAPTNELIGVAMTGDGYRADGHFRLRLDEASLAAWVFEQRKTAVVEDAHGDPRASARMREAFGAHAALAAPLLLEGEVSGALVCIDRRPRRYGERERAMAEALAREAALALRAHRLRLESEAAAAARREQTELVRQLMDATEEGVFGVDTQGNCVFVNRAALRMLGYARPEDLLGRNIHATIHHTYPDGRPYPREECAVRHSTLEGQPAHADDEVHWRADGTSFPVEFWSRPTFRDGTLTGAVITCIDISERKRTEHALRESEQRFRALVELSSDWYWRTDAEHRFVLREGEILRRMGIPPEADYGLRRWEIAGFVNMRDADWAAHRAALDRRETFRDLLLERRSPGGRTHWATISGEPLFDESGTCVGYHGTGRDVTEQIVAERALRASEASLRHQADLLEHRVAERTAELAAANRELDAFASAVAHDLRAPLRGIEGFGKLLEDRLGAALDTEGRGFLQRIRASALRMGRIIDELLEFSRLNRSELRLRWVNLSQLARTIADELQRTAPQRQVRWSIAEPLQAWADPTLVHLALENLLGNAWKYSGKRADAHVEFGVAANAHGRPEYYVRDNGAGFDMAHAEMLFQPFRRLHGQHEFEGTGIGLATVQRIIQRHGGTIRGEGIVGQGSVFRFTLPEPP